MKKILFLLTMAFPIIFALPAAADPYFIGSASLASLGDLDGDNVGYSAEAGWTNGSLAIGLEYSEHRHMGNVTPAGAVNSHIFLSDWTVQPFLTAGLGEVVDGGDPLVQVGGGLLYHATPGFGIFVGYKHRFYLDDWSGLTEFDNYGDSQDGYAEVGLMLTF